MSMVLMARGVGVCWRGLALELQGAALDGLNDAVVAELIVAHGQGAEVE